MTLWEKIEHMLKVSTHDFTVFCFLSCYCFGQRPKTKLGLNAQLKIENIKWTLIYIPLLYFKKKFSIFSLHLLQTEMKSWPGIGSRGVLNWNVCILISRMKREVQTKILSIQKDRMRQVQVAEINILSPHYRPHQRLHRGHWAPYQQVRVHIFFF